MNHNKKRYFCQKTIYYYDFLFCYMKLVYYTRKSYYTTIIFQKKIFTMIFFYAILTYFSIQKNQSKTIFFYYDFTICYTKLHYICFTSNFVHVPLISKSCYSMPSFFCLNLSLFQVLDLMQSNDLLSEQLQRHRHYKILVYMGSITSRDLDHRI